MKKLLGIIALLIGVGLLAWIAYNLFVEMQPEAKGRRVIGPVIFAIASIGMGIKWLIGKKKAE